MPRRPPDDAPPESVPPDLAREYEELVESLDEVVYCFDRSGRWSFLSRAWEKRVGWCIADCIGRPAVRYVYPEERAEVMERWRDVLAGRHRSYRREVRFLSAAGECRWMLVSARELRDRSGCLRGVTGTLTDVSAAKAVEAELIAARAAAEAANKSKSEFLATMSHELRTPLNAVIGLSESLLEMGPPFEPEQTRRYLGIIQQSGRLLLSQINDILDLARIEAGRLRAQRQPFDLGRLCTTAFEPLRREIRAKRLAAQLEVPAEPVMVEADERLLRQVVQNLVSNAIKFTGEGGRVSLSLSAPPAGAVRIAITDTGIGITPEMLPRLFKPFSQADSSLSRQFGGSGLGLALVERIMRLHGGTVSARSALEEGSTFTIELPAGCRLPSTPPTCDTGSARAVLLVDDDPVQHTLVGDYLRHRGFEVVHCANGPAALAVLDARSPRLAVVDVNMPGMNGLDLIRRIRQRPESVNLPILAVTALAECEDVDRCLAAGATAHLPKPVSLGELAERIQRLAGVTS